MIILVASLYLPILGTILTLATNGPKATPGGILAASIFFYVLQVGFILVIAPGWIPSEIKGEWEHRRLKARALRSRKK